MNRVSRLGLGRTAPRCVVLLTLALLIIVSQPAEARAAVAAPTGLSVTSASGAQISVTWSAAPGAARYQVERAQSKAGPYTVVGNPTTNSFTDNGVAAGRSYIYRVRAVDADGKLSGYTNAVVATAVAFTDTLTAGVTPIKALHFAELRLAVDSVRQTAGLPGAAWTDPNLVGAQVRGVHLTELRNSLSQALGALDIPAPVFTDPAISIGAGGTTIKKVHIDELRRFSASMPDDKPAPVGDDDLPVVTACPAPQTWPSDGATIVANVVALDQVLFYNRLGALNPAGMIFALERDVVPIDPSQAVGPGNAQLRPGKRPRPLTLRVNSGQKLQINFKNWLAHAPKDDNQPHTRTASVHVMGLQLVNGIADDGSHVGQNDSSLVEPGGSATYTYFAEREGTHLLYSTAATTGGEGDGGSLSMGLFGAVNVEPKGAEWYRSQVTAAEMRYATKHNPDGTPVLTGGSQPTICYDATFPAGHSRQYQPVLKMLGPGNEIVHSDLNAIITGPQQGRLPAGTYPAVKVSPDREQPFREFTVVYHDEIKAIQAFPQFEDEVLGHTLHSVRDAFAINYGTGGIGSEIIANRLGVGPMGDCTECLYEEFFLSAWTVGDPAQIVDVPANTIDPDTGQLKPGAKATKVLYPDDPSNVHHSYLNDHVKMRVLHAGPKEHHVHHLHAHQWLHTPDSDNSTYLDSQAMGPGYSFTTEIAHGGSGNRNKTPGDSIFHCHFYPHFAQGMWELWRVHDVFESGTTTDIDGRPTQGTRALPDGEIANGTPIPGIVPVPTIAMAPMPTAKVSIVNGQPLVSDTGYPGYPFFVPGVAGHRPPKPPLDTVDDGGLPRHVIKGGVAVHHKEHDPQFSFAKARLDFDKEVERALAQAVPEAGTLAEKAAMTFHAQAQHSSFKPDGTAAPFLTNGLPAKAGAPFADPCRNDDGAAFGTPRTYKSANIQLDVTFNKAGWHFPQQRISVLWDDVRSTINGQRPPEPLFFRANSNDCITFHHTNLAPKVYVQDDFQVRTPTDVMGQHIHLVKFDVLASDGSGNGFNYEDGTFSPAEVVGRIRAIRKYNGCSGVDSGDSRDGTFTCPVARAHPTLGLAGRDDDGNGVDDWLGAQTTIQRWLADDVLNSGREDRTLRTVFTHDHFGPSTHQQVGLYAGLVIEPQGSTWRHPETGQSFGGRTDGGPTSWRADILWVNPKTGKDESYREFLLEFSDFQLAYKQGGGVDGAGRPAADPARAINPPVKNEVGLPNLVLPAQQCPGGAPLPCPEAVSAADPGTMVVNYRNEPVALRVVDDPDSSAPQQAPGVAGDLSHAFRSDVTRAYAPMNTQPSFVKPLTLDVRPGDPATPLLRAYEDDKVQVRVLVGGFEEGHNFGVQGVRWLFEPSDPNSGYRNNQMMGISEHYEFEIPQFPGGAAEHFIDYRYAPGTAVDDLWNGLWGMVRAYSAKRSAPNDVLLELPNNPKGLTKTQDKSDFTGVCPKTAPTKSFDVTAILARDTLAEQTLVYNHRTNQGGRLHDPTAIMYVQTKDLDANYKLDPDMSPEPLVLRANAGDCIEVTLRNRLPNATPPDLDGFNTLPMIVNRFNANELKPSKEVGLHPQLVFFDVSSSNGMNVGHNPVQTVAPGHFKTYQWYAGGVSVVNNKWVPTPIEFGSINLSPADPIKHTNKGAIGALIIEPRQATWPDFEWVPNPDRNSPRTQLKSRAQLTVTPTVGTPFREFVLLFQNDLNLRFGDGSPVPNTAEAEDSEDSGQKGFNYRTEPMWKRMGYAPQTHLSCGEDENGMPITTCTRNFDFSNSLSNITAGGEDPVTPVFTAGAGVPVRFRVLHPGGHARNNVFQLHGHIWEEEPYTNSSTVLGRNQLSEWKGSQYGIGPGSHFDLLLKNGAGGKFAVRGDYLFRDQGSFPFDGGLWGIFRVQ